MATGDKRTGPKKYDLAIVGITDELRMNGAKMCQQFSKILENSTDIRSESYWHQINCLVERWLVTKEQVQKKYGLAVAGIADELQTNVTDNKWRFSAFFGGLTPA